MQRVRMITSLSARDYDLPYGTVLVVGDVLAPQARQLDSATAERWLGAGVIEKLNGEFESIQNDTFNESETPAPPARTRGRKAR